MFSDTVSPLAQREQAVEDVVFVVLPSSSEVSLNVGLIMLPSSTEVMLKVGQQSICAANATSVQRNSSASRDDAASEREAQVSPPLTSRVGSIIVAVCLCKYSNVEGERGGATSEVSWAR